MITMKRIWAQHVSCLGRTHCGPCRDLVGGHDFRRSLAVAFHLPAGAPDFACPHGVPWAGGVAPATAPTGEQVAAGEPEVTLDQVMARAASAVQVCVGCESFSSRTDSPIGPKVYCRAAPPCCGGGLGTVSLYYANCPQGRWGEGSIAGNGRIDRHSTRV